jgi:WD40 repeat protein
VSHAPLCIAGAGKIARIWDIPSGNLVAKLKGNASSDDDSRYVTNILFFDDDKKVATANVNATTVIWDAAAGRPLPCTARRS